MIPIMDYVSIDTYALCAIIFLHMLLYVPVIETYVLFTIFLIVLVWYNIDDNFIIEYCNRGLSSTRPSRVSEIREIVENTNKYQHVITSQCIIISAPT
jgi:hypothetical protein